jgi:hypothetical protein
MDTEHGSGVPMHRCCVVWPRRFALPVLLGTDTRVLPHACQLQCLLARPAAAGAQVLSILRVPVGLRYRCRAPAYSRLMVSEGLCVCNQKVLAEIFVPIPLLKPAQFIDAENFVFSPHNLTGFRATRTG